MYPVVLPCFHQGLEHNLLVALPSGEQDDQRFALAFGAQMQFGAEAPLAPSQRLISPAFARSRCVLMGTNHRPIDEMERPTDVSTLIYQGRG
jgi:hypothetical protein